MTAPVITTDGQTWNSGGVSYVSMLAQKRWKRSSVTVVQVDSSITTEMISDQAIRPNKANLAVTFATTPPGSPSQSAWYVITATATGAWVGKENNLTNWDGSVWRYYPLYEGIIVWDQTADKIKAWDGTAWEIVNEYTLPERLAAQSSVVLANANSATESGKYLTDNSTTNTPYAATWMIDVTAVSPGDTITQYATDITADSAADSKKYRRGRNGGTWDSTWEPILETRTELDARYLQKAGTLIEFAVLDRDLSIPPVSPTIGAKYIPKATATGAWAGHENKVAEWTTGGWVFTVPADGTPIWITDEQTIVYYATSVPRDLHQMIIANAAGITALKAALASLTPGGSWDGLGSYIGMQLPLYYTLPSLALGTAVNGADLALDGTSRYHRYQVGGNLFPGTTWRVISNQVTADGTAPPWIIRVS